MSNFKPSKYQENIIDFIKNKQGNLLVDAKAGSGKTSTLILIADEIIAQNRKCLFLAFNKSIVDELSTRIVSDNCQIKTLHSLGLSFLRSYLYKKHGQDYVLDIDQHNDFIKEQVKILFNEYCKEDFEQATSEFGEQDRKDLYNNVIREIAQMVDFSRLYNIDYRDPERLYDLGYKLCYCLKNYDDHGLQQYPNIVRDIIDKIKYRFENPEKDDLDRPVYNVTYTDMIYLPCLYKMYAPYSIRSFLDYVLIDECQDLSVLQQLFLKRLWDTYTRFIFVGDEKQSIYGFAGADTRSIQNLKRNFTLTELPLNICYRCPENVIRLSKEIVPAIDWNHDREDIGEVKFFDEKNLVNLIQPGDVIIGRRNKDLVRLYKKLVLEDNKSVKFKNIEMVNTIVNEIERVVKEYINLYNTYSNVDKELYKACDEKGINWQLSNDKLSKADQAYMKQKAKEISIRNKTTGKLICKSKYNINYLETCMKEYKEEGAYQFVWEGMPENVLNDYFDVIEILIDVYKKQKIGVLVKEFLDYTKTFLKGNIDREVPILSSIHMMKGGEANNVYILNYPRFPYIYSSQTEDAKQQEKNLQYVALTRAKKNLYLGRIARPNVPREDEDDILSLNASAEMLVNQILNRHSK